VEKRAKNGIGFAMVALAAKHDANGSFAADLNLEITKPCRSVGHSY
jgi:hypothetical protein